MADELRLTLLGKPQATLGSTPVTDFIYRKSLALLCYLAVTGRPHSREALIGLLWPEATETSARASLRKTLADLRKRLAPYLIITHQEVALNRDVPYWLDVEAFEACVGASTSERDIKRLQEAVEFYQADFLEGFYVRNAFEFEEWVLAQRGRLRELALQALHTLATHFTDQGEAGRAPAIDYTTRLLSLEPWREEAHRGMMRLLALSGQRGAALAQYKTCCQVLAEELGVEPGTETAALYEHIRDGELRPAELVSAPAFPRISAPDFLQAQETPPIPERSIFVAREAELAQLDRLLERALAGQGRVAFVIGEPGSGKTVLVREFVRRAMAREPVLVAARGSSGTPS
jgi:DNA-binding SARP family transcriptional activator